jgi:hypothetical protein
MRHVLVVSQWAFHKGEELWLRDCQLLLHLGKQLITIVPQPMTKVGGDRRSLPTNEEPKIFVVGIVTSEAFFQQGSLYVLLFDHAHGAASPKTIITIIG